MARIRWQHVLIVIALVIAPSVWHLLKVANHGINEANDRANYLFRITNVRDTSIVGYSTYADPGMIECKVSADFRNIVKVGQDTYLPLKGKMRRGECWMIVP